MTGEIRTWVDNQACDTLMKRSRKARQKRRGTLGFAIAHPTKKVTRGRLKMAHALPRGHRRFSIRQLIRWWLR
ncbi:MAG TPA: hypothetical protein VGA50_04805 [Kiloniellales bacterium]